MSTDRPQAGHRPDGSPPRRPAGPLRRRLREQRGNGVAVLGVLLFFLAWVFMASREPDFILPGPSTVLSNVWSFLDPTSAMAADTYTSLVRVLIATFVAVLIGSAAVLIADEIPLLRPLVHKSVMPFLNSFPSLGWAMLGVIWLGIGNTSVVFMEAAILVPFSMLNTAAGCQAIDDEIAEMGRSFTRNKLRVLRRVKLPLLAPYVFAATRTSYGVAWKVALIAELFGASSGLGYQMDVARQNFNTPQVLAAVAVVVLFVYLVDFLVFAPLARHLPVLRRSRG